MKAERWQQVERLYHSTLEKEVAVGTSPGRGTVRPISLELLIVWCEIG